MGILLLIYLQVLLLYLTTASGLYTYQIQDRCDDVINVYKDSRPSGLVSFILHNEPIAAINNHCDVTIEAGYSRSAILFYYTAITMPDCRVGGMDILVATASRSTLKPFPDQSRRVCGAGASSIQNNIYTTQEAPLTFRFSWDNSSSTSVSASFTLFYNTFNELANCDGFECTNGRCIDESATCSGYDACGDNSDCPEKDEAAAATSVATYVATAVFFTIFVIASCGIFVGFRRFRSSSSRGIDDICDCLCGVLAAICWPCRKAYEKRHQCSECVCGCCHAICCPCRKAYDNRQRCSDCVTNSGNAIRNCPRRLACCLTACESNTEPEVVTTQPPVAVSTVSIEVQTQTAGASQTDPNSLPLEGAVGDPPPYGTSDSPPSYKPRSPKGHHSNRHRPRPLPSAPPTTEEDSPPTYDAVMENYNHYTRDNE